MKNFKISLITSFLLYSAYTFNTPVVEVDLPGMLGNRLFAFCVGKIIAEKLGYDLYCPPIWGFPNTYLYNNNRPSGAYPTEHIRAGHDIDIEAITSDHRLRNIKLEGYFQRYRYFESYTEQIRNEWLKMDSSPAKQDPDDIVIHIRSHYAYFVPFEYYEKALASTSYNRVFICIDEPNDPFLENFKKYNPIVKSTRSLNQLMYSSVPWPEISRINLDDFLFITSFNKIILSQSTYAWWAGFLSDAQEIYAPFCSSEQRQVYGKVNEPRYHYIDVLIGNY